MELMHIEYTKFRDIQIQDFYVLICDIPLVIHMKYVHLRVVAVKECIFLASVCVSALF